jgi:hypothetical protein
VEERIIGAGLKSLKGEDAPAIKALFEMFAVTQEDFVHPMAVIELLWRMCCTSSTEAAGGLSARLKVRQWTQVLIDQSLLLGSSAKGMHLHDIVLTYLRSTQSAVGMRALQKRVVEGLVAASTDRTAATGRGFQDTGSTAKAFDGEEVDWYVCNVASYHVKQSMDPSLTLVENDDLQRWLQVDDELIVRAVAAAMGMAELDLLLAGYSAAEEWFKASKVAWAMGMVSVDRPTFLKHAKAALDFLQRAGSATTAELGGVDQRRSSVQQLELGMRGKLAYVFATRSPDKKPNAARMMELMAQNKSLRCDPLGLCLMSIVPRVWALLGVHPSYWDAGKIATQDTVCEGLRLWMYEAMPLYLKAMEESVGARKECIRIGYVLSGSVDYMGNRSDQTADAHHRVLEEKWGEDGSILSAGCMDYRFDRHFAISKAIGMKFEQLMAFSFAQGATEHCGDVQQMVQLFEKQLGAMREFFKRGVVGIELGYYLCLVAPSFTGLELNVLCPFGKELTGLLGSCEGQCTDPSDCEEWFTTSAQWSAHRARLGEGFSSKNGLHQMFLKLTVIATVQAVLSLSLASVGNCNFDLSWLDDLPAADDPKLHCSMTAGYSFANTRVLIAEVLEWQGRHKEAIRCENNNLFCLCNHVCDVLLPVELQLCGCRVTSGLQLLRIIEGTRWAGARTMPCSAGGACTLGVSIRRGYPAGKCRALLAIRGAGDPRSGAGRASCRWEQTALGRAHEEAAAGGDDGADAGGTGAARAATCIAGVDGPKRDESGLAPAMRPFRLEGGL